MGGAAEEQALAERLIKQARNARQEVERLQLELAVALAVGLCGWRLDLAAEIARARREDLLNPFGWFTLRAGFGASPPCSLGGLHMSCPIALLDQGAESEIRS